MISLLKAFFGDHSDPAEQFAALFGDGASTTPDAVSAAVEWSRRLLAEKGSDPHQRIAAVHAFRAAEPRLALKPATRLASLVTA